VRGDEIGQSTLFNLLLRNYLRYSHLEAAYNLIEKCSFPEGKSNNEFCKYLYYTGRVKAVRREYGESLDMLNQAIRKCPDTAKGFKISCQKAAIVVELLLGEIPNREIFSDVLIFTNVYPYYKLIQVVLEGELSNFNRTVEEYKPTFQKDGLYNIILRLNQIVIRIGLRKISLAYSRISLADIASKLNIPGEDVEFVVAKALIDGIIQGEIDHESQILRI
jgi:26S proteasome regulatory subunit N3